MQFADGIGGAAPHRPAVGGAEAVHRALPPGIGKRGEPWRRGGPRLADLPHRGDRRVIERADHAGDVAQRRALAPPRRDRASRLALEIDQVEIVLHRDHLAEVQIAVKAGLHSGDLVRRQAADRLE